MRRFWRNAEFFQATEDFHHRSVWVSKEDTASHPNKTPSESLKECLPFHVFLQFVEAVPALAVTFNREHLASANNHKVNPIGPNVVLRQDVVLPLHQAAQHGTLKDL